MKPLLLAGHPALEFFNTTMVLHGAPVELIGDGGALLEWAAAVGLLDEGAASAAKRRFGAGALDEVAAEARKVRAWASAWVDRWRLAPNDLYEPELRRLNGLLSRANDVRQLVRQGGRLEIVERRRGEGPDEIVGAVASQIAALLAEEEPSLVKRCGGAECTLWFVDRTKAHRRKFCSATACGNREKVAAFRARERQEPSK